MYSNFVDRLFMKDATFGYPSEFSAVHARASRGDSGFVQIVSSPQVFKSSRFPTHATVDATQLFLNNLRVFQNIASDSVGGRMRSSTIMISSRSQDRGRCMSAYCYIIGDFYPTHI